MVGYLGYFFEALYHFMTLSALFHIAWSTLLASSSERCRD